MSENIDLKKNDLLRKARFQVHLGFNRSWRQYDNDYKRIVDDIIESIEKGKFYIDEVALPLLFLIRHSLELGLKANIYEFEKVNVGIEKFSLKNSQGHSLEYLYEKFIEHVEYIKNSSILQKEVLDQIERYKLKSNPLIQKMHNLDKGSYSFRYPVDKNKKYNFDFTLVENVGEIIEMYNNIQPFLLYSIDVLIPEAV